MLQKNELVKQVRYHTEQIYLSGEYPSYRSVILYVNKMSFSAELRELWRSKLKKLGVIERVNQW